MNKISDQEAWMIINTGDPRYKNRDQNVLFKLYFAGARFASNIDEFSFGFYKYPMAFLLGIWKYIKADAK